MKLLLKFIVILIIALLIVAIPLSVWLKTDSAKEQITNFMESTLSKELGANVKIDGIYVALPIILNAKMVSFADANGKIMHIKNMYINIVPSLMSFWELSIWQISADEIRVFKEPKFKPVNKKKGEESFFNPDIIIKNIDFGAVVLDSKFTGSKDVAFSIDSHVVFRTNKKKLDFALVGKLLKPELNEFADNLLELVGQYNLKNELLELKSIKLNSKILQVEGNLFADIKNDKLSGLVKYKTDYVGDLVAQKFEGAKGKMFGQINFLGSVTIPQIKQTGNLDLQIPKNDYFNYYPLSWESDLKIVSNNIDGSISFKQGDITASGNIGFKDSKLYLKNMKAEAPDFLKTVNIVFDTKSKIITGEVGFRDKNLKETSKYFPFLNRGAVDLNLKYSSVDNKTQKLKVKGRLKQLSTKFGSSNYIDIDLNILDLWNVELGDSKLQFKSINYNEFLLKNANFGIKSKDGVLQLNGEVSSGQPYPTNFKFNSDIQQDKVDNNVIAEITSLSGMLRGVPFGKDGDIKIKSGSDNIFNVKDLKIGQGVLNLDGIYGKDSLKINMNSRQVPLAALPDVFSRALKGSLLDSKIVLSGTKNKPELNIDAELSSINFDNNNNLSMKINGKYARNKIEIHSRVDGQDRELASFDAVLPVNFSIEPFVFDINKKQKLNASLVVLKKFDLISLIPKPIGHVASGSIVGRLSASGTMLNPNVSGRMNLSNGRYSYKQYGVKLKNIIGNISGNGSDIMFKDIVASDVYGNKISGFGDLNLNDDNKFKFHVETEKFHPMNTRYLQGEVKGNIDIIGNNEQAKAKGEFGIGPLEIKIPEHFRKNIPALNISEVIAENDDVVKEITAKPYDLKLDIKLKSDKQVYIRGWGVDAQLKGDLHITGKADDPVVTGVLKSDRGRYQEFGKTLKVKEAVLNFDGPISPSPYLNIVGVTNVGETEIRLVLSGSILNPDISMESTPALSQEEALSKLLFGNGLENISTFQALQLADGVRKLSGHGGGFDPLGLGRKILGVDDISFKSDSEDPDKSSIGVGKHLSDKVYFEIESGRSENSTKTRVEIQLTPRISIENVVEPEGNTSLGINWRFDY